jgi:hypothetical protein
VEDKKKVKELNVSKEKKEELLLIIDMLGNVIDSQDKEALSYAYTAYKFMVKANRLKLLGRIKKTENLIKDIYNGF